MANAMRNKLNGMARDINEIKAETYVEPYSHVTIEITEEDVRAPSRSVVDLDYSIMGVSVLKKYGEEGDE